MRRTFIKTLALSAMTAALGLAAAPVLAQANFKIMIGANPGGGYDQTGRGIGKALQEAGVASGVTYENKGGAGGTIGLAQFANAAKGDPNALVVTGAVMVGRFTWGTPSAGGREPGSGAADPSGPDLRRVLVAANAAQEGHQLVPVELDHDEGAGDQYRHQAMRQGKTQQCQ